MSDSAKPPTLRTAEEHAIWRSYFQAALTGLLAAGELPATSTSLVKQAMSVADAAFTAEAARK
jgi:hypothetical protein